MNHLNLIENENLQRDREKLQQIANKYGAKKQTIKAIEEMAELMKEICKYLLSESEEPSHHLIEEIADVKNMEEQLVYLFDCKRQVENIQRIKINRQIERMRGVQ